MESTIDMGHRTESGNDGNYSAAVGVTSGMRTTGASSESSSPAFAGTPVARSVDMTQSTGAHDSPAPAVAADAPWLAWLRVLFAWIVNAIAIAVAELRTIFHPPAGYGAAET